METFIGQWYLEDLNTCDALIDFFKTSEEKKQGLLGGKILRKDVKDSIDIGVEKLPQDLYTRYFDQLKVIIDQYIDRYEYALMAPFNFTQPGNIQYYAPGMGFHLYHCERTEVHPHIATRHLVYMTYLNDVDDGGETDFYYQKLKIKPRKGLTLIWPADWTHTHRGITSNTQEKYIITGWLNYIAR